MDRVFRLESISELKPADGTCKYRAFGSFKSFKNALFVFGVCAAVASQLNAIRSPVPANQQSSYQNFPNAWEGWVVMPCSV